MDVRSKSWHVRAAMAVGFVMGGLVLFVVFMLVAATLMDRDNKRPGAPTVAAPRGDTLVAQPGVPTAFAPPSDVSWSFVGLFADAACRMPVAQHAFGADEAVSFPAATAHVDFVEGLGGHPPFSEKGVPVARRLDAHEPVWSRTNGACVRAEVGVKRVPPACNGRRLCRTNGGMIGCGGCRMTASGAPAYEGAMAYLAFVP